jgi:hypothetical protein
MNMIQVLKRIANTSVNTFSFAIMSIRPLFEEIWTGNAICRTNVVPRQERVKNKNKIQLTTTAKILSKNCGLTIRRIDLAAVGRIKGIPIHPLEGSCSGSPIPRAAQALGRFYCLKKLHFY